MWGWLYLELVAVAVGATYLGLTPPERRAAIVQPVAALSASVLFALLALASLNVVVVGGGSEVFVDRSFYLVVLWAGASLLNLVGLVTGVFERELEEREGARPRDAGDVGGGGTGGRMRP